MLFRPKRKITYYKETYTGTKRIHIGNTMSLDDLDLQIIKWMQKDARISITALAKNVQSSRPTVQYRLNRLMDEGYLNLSGGLDLAKTGYKVALIGIEVKKRVAMQETEKHLRNCPRVQLIYMAPGTSNMQVQVWGENDENLGRLLNCFREMPDTEIKDVLFLGAPTYGEVNLDVDKILDVGKPCTEYCHLCPGYTEDEGCPRIKV
jgi:Lrp/AsnC family transcriptional regulator for asnA, asnC and gidA